MTVERKDDKFHELLSTIGDLYAGQNHCINYDKFIKLCKLVSDTRLEGYNYGFDVAKDMYRNY